MKIETEALKLKNEAFLRDFLQKRSLQAQKRNFFRGTFFKHQASRLKNEAFLLEVQTAFCMAVAGILARCKIRGRGRRS